MVRKRIRIGIVGAGANTRLRHVPGFRALADVELVGVVNRTIESSQRAARDLGIPRDYASWSQLVAERDIDAVMIGTWPNLHCEVTCAALAAGKHVLTEARMARNAAEARQMLAAARGHPELITQVVPSPFGLAEHDFVRGLIDDGFLGELRELVVIGANDQFWDERQPLHWRQDGAISGFNLLAMGILHETAMRWAPPTRRVFAQTAIFGTSRSTAEGQVAQVTVPDSAQVVTLLENGGRGLYHLSGCALFGPGLQIHLYGSRGTIKLEFAPHSRLWIGQAGGKELRLAEIPPEKRGGWRVEAEFIGAIRREEPVRFTNFETALTYMEFTEAVARSAQFHRPVDLPLAN
jgi:predicted dehydrogenase